MFEQKHHINVLSMSEIDLDQLWINEVYAYSNEYIVNVFKFSEGEMGKKNKYFANIHHMLFVGIIEDEELV